MRDERWMEEERFMMAKLITQQTTKRKIPGSIPALATQSVSQASSISINQHKLTQPYMYIISLNAQAFENVDKDFEIVPTSRAKGQLSDIIINMTDIDWED